ncbi:hypothetical protein GCM10010211_15610 [Streptomyces albospinus]|uniref:Uncharacterized protein n=1 Tax=Streptomyces albospinus TaxID=285515 RepID=A0ABQ2UUB9_9ACTN|nr:hypothetical protein [Streptomyces albospinus]GGU52096.1 hypothetical protein GCM10010211_15610 [Streptomyces albospinus]
MAHQRSDDETEPTWGSLCPRDKVLAAFGMTGLGLGVLALGVLVLLLTVLVVAAVSRGLIESDGVGPFIWGAVLCLPCGLLAAVLIHPLRLLLRLSSVTPKAKRGAEMALSAATTFLAAMFVEDFAPGPRVQHPWLPALLATLLVALANVVINHLENRKKEAGSSC